MRLSFYGWIALAAFLGACEPEPCDLPGQTVPIGAGPASPGFRFYDWQGDKQFVNQRRDSASSVTMPARQVSIWPRSIESYVSGISYCLAIAPLWRRTLPPQAAMTAPAARSPA